MTTLLLNRGMAEDEGSDQPFCYLVTDIETDGPEPGANSMLSFASVVVDQHGRLGAAFEGRLQALPEAQADADTLAWLQSHPQAWADATRDPQPAAQVMQDYVQWIRDLPVAAVFTANPLAFDGFWIDWYLRRFSGLRLVCGPYGGERLFLGAGLDLPSLLMGTTGWDYGRCRRENYPDEWFGGYLHTHLAIDDARGYACVLAEALRQKTSVHNILPDQAM